METPKIPSQPSICPTKVALAEESRIVDADGSFDTNPITAREIACEAGCIGPKDIARVLFGKQVPFLPKKLVCGLEAVASSVELQQGS